MKWHFRPYAPGEKTRDPIQGEFFATDAIRNPAEALIREGIQNSLDAQLKNDDGEPASLPWVSRVAEFHQPQRGCAPVSPNLRLFDGPARIQRAIKCDLTGETPLGFAIPYRPLPKVARWQVLLGPSQPWAGGQNPFGIFIARHNLTHSP